MRTYKPVRYDPVERKLLTSDKNNDKKFAFITQETVVDYRSVEVSQFFLPCSPSVAPFYIIAGFFDLLTGSSTVEQYLYGFAATIFSIFVLF